MVSAGDEALAEAGVIEGAGRLRVRSSGDDPEEEPAHRPGGRRGPPRASGPGTMSLARFAPDARALFAAVPGAPAVAARWCGTAADNLRWGRGRAGRREGSGSSATSAAGPCRQPIEARGARTEIDELARRLASVTAERFVAATPAAEHGLADPRFVVRVHFEGALPSDEEEDLFDDGHDHDHGQEAPEGEDPGPRTHELRVGAATDGGAFAQLGDDDAVFVLPASVVEAVEAPLVSRNLLASDVDFIEALTIERDGQVTELSQGELSWQTQDGPADGDRVRRLLDAIEDLRALEVGPYGPAPAEHGMDTPRARVTVRRAEGGDEPLRYTLRVGAVVGEGEGARVAVRREDLDVSFLVAARTVDPLVTVDP